jgi:hypothetical protein
MYKAQYAFNMSMIMCPAVHMATRSLLRSSSTHEPSDPLSRVKFYFTFSFTDINLCISDYGEVADCIGSELPWRNPLETNNTSVKMVACEYQGFSIVCYTISSLHHTREIKHEAQVNVIQ